MALWSYLSEFCDDVGLLNNGASVKITLCSCMRHGVCLGVVVCTGEYGVCSLEDENLLCSCEM